MAHRPDDDGAVHMLEAILASVLVLTALFFVNSPAVIPAKDGHGGLDVLSSDVLNAVMYKDDIPGHPSLGYVLSTPGRWAGRSGNLSSDIADMLPDGVYFYMVTPLGTIGQPPADGMETFSRPFVAYVSPRNVADCKLILWRP